MKTFGVRHFLHSPSPVLERLGDALPAQKAGDGGSPFDFLLPWSGMRRCNLSRTGEVLSYEGDSAYDPQGDVMVEIPPFYQKSVVTEDFQEWWISPLPQPGYRLSPVFSPEEDPLPIYIGAYLSEAIPGGNSTPGVYGGIRTTRTRWRELLSARGSGFGMMDIVMLTDVLWPLFLIEFATLDSSSVMEGITSMPYCADWGSLSEEPNTNRIIVDSIYGEEFVIGQGIGIGHCAGDGDIVSHATVVSLRPVGDQRTAIYFDGNPVNIHKGDVVYSSLWKNGMCDQIKSSIGSPGSLKGGKSPFVWRGLENIYGHTWEWIDGINILDRHAFVSLDRETYNDTSTDGPYLPIGFVNAGVDESFITEISTDPLVPYVHLPTACGGAPSTYFSDCYWYRDGMRGVIFGGSWYNGKKAGLFCFSGWSDADFLHINNSARLTRRGKKI